MATVYADSGSMPVKVRNLSSTGALIEGPVLPQKSANVRLCRGSLEIGGTIMWCKDGGAGLRFNSAINVADWLPRGRSAHPQQRIDQLVQSFKAERRRGATTSIAALPPSGVSAADLDRISRALGTLADELASDPHVIGKFGVRLQVLEMAIQALRKVQPN